MLSRRACPSCGEKIKLSASVCRFCGHVLPEQLVRNRKSERFQIRLILAAVALFLLWTVGSGIYKDAVRYNAEKAAARGF